jgi:hypothetical protein
MIGDKRLTHQFPRRHREATSDEQVTNNVHPSDELGDEQVANNVHTSDELGDDALCHEEVTTGQA